MVAGLIAAVVLTVFFGSCSSIWFGIQATVSEGKAISEKTNALIEKNKGTNCGEERRNTQERNAEAEKRKDAASTRHFLH